MATRRKLLPMGCRVGSGFEFTVQAVHLPLVWAVDAFANAASGQCEATGPTA